MIQTSFRRKWLPFLGLYAVLMAIFAFTDLNISLRLINMDSIFGKFAESCAEVPMNTISMFAYAILFVTRPKKRSVWTVLAKALFFAATFEYAFFILFFSVKYLVPSRAVLAGVIGGVPFGIIALLLTKRLVRTNRDVWVRAAIVVAVSVFLMELLANLLLKVIWARPLMRDLTSPSEGFMPWYLPHSSTLGGSSFPSGHTAGAASTFCLTMLCDIVDKLKGKQWLFSLFALFWTVLIGVGRIVLAAHFASDVTTGAFIMLLAFELTKSVTDIISPSRKTKPDFRSPLNYYSSKESMF